MRFFTQILLVLTIGFSAFVEGNTQQVKNSGDNKMKSWSLGRIDFSIPQQYVLSGRTQNIYYVDVSEIPLEGRKPEDVWISKVKEIKAKHIKAGYKEETTQIKEMEPSFNVIFYQDNPTSPELVKFEAQKTVGDNLLEMSFEGQAGKESDMLRGLSIIANAYHEGVSYGFNVGTGSITSTPGLNEYARAGFKDQEYGTKINVSTRVATKNLNDHPLDDVKYEIKGLAQDGIKLKVLKNVERVVAGFKGYEGHISLESQNEEPEFRFTWFTPGVTADSFKPEILIKVHGPLKDIEAFKVIWEELLKSLKIRSVN